MVELELARRTELRSKLVNLQNRPSDKDTEPSPPASEGTNVHTESSAWPAGGANEASGRPACSPRDAKPACLEFGGADTAVAPIAVRVLPVRTFLGAVRSGAAPTPLAYEDADRQCPVDEAARLAIERS